MMIFFCFNLYNKYTNFYTKLNSILIVNVLIFSVVLVQFNSILFAEAKCVMRSPCTPRAAISSNEDPYSQKWYNCYNETEPVPLETSQGLADFKRLCAPLYTHDEQPLCCNEEQLFILKKDLFAAETVIGSCASCYLNFRLMWCHMTCSPNQSEFIVPRLVELRPRVNFTKLYIEHEEYKLEQKKAQNEEDEEKKCAEKMKKDKHNDEQEEEEEKEEKEGEGVENEHDTSTASATVIHDNHYENENNNLNNHETHENNEHTEERRKRNVDEKSEEQSLAVIEIDYHISGEFLSNLIKSCRDIKLYGDDAIIAICGVNSKWCTPQKMLDFLGTYVPERPFDIHANITNETEYYLQNKVTKLNGKDEIRNYRIRPVNPKYHLCNETYQYGDLDYGAKCSCKACQDSCELYDEFRIVKRRKEFKIGKLDGAGFIMALIFGVFVLAFLKSLSFFRKHRKANDLDAIYEKTSRVSKFKQLLCWCAMRSRTKTESIQLENDINLEHHSDGYEEKNEILFPKRVSQLNFLDKMKYIGEKLESFIEERFTRLGKFCAVYPGVVLTIGLAFCAIMCLGYFNFKVEKDPVKLWSAETSIARQNKKYFDENFNPFYRITQLIIEPKPHIEPIYDSDTDSNITVFQDRILHEAYDIYNRINSIRTVCTNCEEIEPVTLEDICYQPLWPENTNCATQAVFQYWQNDAAKIEEALLHKSGSPQKHLQICMKNPYEADCLSSFGGPIHSYMVAGSYHGDDHLKANALVLTYVLKNFKKTNIDPIKKAMAWESEVLKLLQNYSSSLIDISYTTERSIEDELERESKADIKIIAISYLMMFVYLTATLGKYSSLRVRVILVEMKIFLGLAGVTLVLLSVFSSGGFFTYLGVPATLITLEVIPFLLLAVGVDNIYVMVQTYQNDERLPDESVEDQIARIVGKVGPSMLLTGTTQSAAFLISAMTPMPGVRAFSLYASLAIILNFLMQITCFVALLTLDAKREKSKRVDILCCFKLNLSDAQIYNHLKSFLHRYFKNIYTPFLFNDYVRFGVICVFVGFFFACISMCDKIKIGLDQKLAMPSDSYQIKYFEALQKHLKVGPPVYFVLKDGYNYSDTSLLRLLCGSSQCDANSLQSIISSAAMFPNETYIAQATVNWIDDYMEWLSANPEASTSYTCCHINLKLNKYCDVKKYPDTSDDCVPCPVNRTVYDFPTGESFHEYLDIFLNQNPSETCVKAGHAMYGNAVKTKLNEQHRVKQIRASHFMAYHTVLSTSDDFINAMVAANQISDLINKILNNRSMSMNNTEHKYEVIPYSIFYVFYEQYVKIWQDATAQLILTLVAIFLCTFILLSFDLFTSLIVTGVIAIIIIDMVGIMYLWNIELNAISLVNLVIAIGISVEFSSHIARAFATSDAKDKKERAAEALCSMGPPVFSGVLQSIVGISVLAFAHSQLFQVFYFRMYFSILVLGLTHGLIFLPVLLSYIGSNLKTKLTIIGRSSNKLHYLKVNQNNLDSNKTQSGEENREIDDSDNSNNNNNNQIEITNETHLNSLKPLSAASPGKSPAKFNTQRNLANNRKPYTKKSLTTSTTSKVNTINNENETDRDSPTSKKSVDLLLNGRNSHDDDDDDENTSNDSNNTSNCLNENGVSHNEKLESSISEKHTGIKEKLNSLNIFKLGKDMKQNSGKFQKMSSSLDVNDDLNENPYKQVVYSNDVDSNNTKKKSSIELRRDTSSSKTELDYLRQASQLIRTPNLSIRNESLTVNGTSKNGPSTRVTSNDHLSQSFNLNRTLLNSNNSITGLYDKMSDKLPYMPKMNGTHDAIFNN